MFSSRSPALSPPMARLQLDSANPIPVRRPAASASDEEILRGLQAGEPRAAERLYDRVHLQVRASLRRIAGGQPLDVDDLMQTTFERMLHILPRRPLRAPYNLRGWASAVAAHVALDALRRAGRERRLFDDRSEAGAAAGPVGAGDPEQRVVARAEVGRLQALLASMRPKYAEAVVLHHVLGHELVEIAEITGVSVAAAQSRLSRGRRELLQKAERQARPRARGQGQQREGTS